MMEEEHRKQHFLGRPGKVRRILTKVVLKHLEGGEEGAGGACQCCVLGLARLGENLEIAS